MAPLGAAPVTYGTSTATVCLDFYAEVPCTPFDFLLGQRAISKAQMAREGKNVRVTKHVRESVTRSCKELFVDVTGKLPGFARAVLPQIVTWMENQVDFPSNTASVVVLKPRSLRGACAFSETLYCDVGERPRYTIRAPTVLAMPVEERKIDYAGRWGNRSCVQDWTPRCVVFKRLLLDVGADNVIMRRIRAAVLGKFVDAFVDMVREVLSCVSQWGANHRPRFESSAQMGHLATPARLWPTHGESVAARCAQLAEEFAALTDDDDAEPTNEMRQRASSSFMYPVE